jgi:hypothetical protein
MLASKEMENIEDLVVYLMVNVVKRRQGKGSYFLPPMHEA